MTMLAAVIGAVVAISGMITGIPLYVCLPVAFFTSFVLAFFWRS